MSWFKFWVLLGKLEKLFPSLFYPVGILVFVFATDIRVKTMGVMLIIFTAWEKLKKHIFP